MPSAQIIANIHQIYISYFGRPADPEGLSFWAGVAEQSGGSLEAIMPSFTTAPEAIKLYGGASGVDARIDAIYQNVFGRSPDAEGKAFWKGLVEKGEISLENLTLSILTGANGNADAVLVQNKLIIAQEFTAKIAAGEAQYAGDAAAAVARTLINSITSDPASVAAEKAKLPAFLNTVSVASKVPEKFADLIQNGVLKDPSIVSTTLTETNIGGTPPSSPVGTVILDPTFSVTNNDGVLQFTGSATGNITLTVNEDGTVTAARDGVDAEGTINLSDIKSVTTPNGASITVTGQADLSVVPVTSGAVLNAGVAVRAVNIGTETYYLPAEASDDGAIVIKNASDIFVGGVTENGTVKDGFELYTTASLQHITSTVSLNWYPTTAEASTTVYGMTLGTTADRADALTLIGVNVNDITSATITTSTSGYKGLFLGKEFVDITLKVDVDDKAKTIVLADVIATDVVIGDNQTIADAVGSTDVVQIVGMLQSGNNLVLDEVTGPFAIQDNEDGLIQLSGTPGDDIFTAATSASLKGGTKDSGTGQPTAGLILDGKEGEDTLVATLGASLAHPDYSPTISNVENFVLTAEGENSDIGLMFTRVTGVESITNKASTANLTVVDVRMPVALAVEDIAASNPRDFAVRYGKDVTLTEHAQSITLNDANLNLLTITKLNESNEAADAGITTLNIDSTGSSAIASFKEQAVSELSLADSLRTINVQGEGGLSLNLAEIKAMQAGDGTFERVTTDLTGFSVGSGDSLNLKAADLSNDTWGNKTDLGDGANDGAPKSIHTIKLPPLGSIAGDISIDNLTIASTTGYTHGPVQNDVVDLSNWDVGSVEALAGMITQIEITKGAGLTAETGGLDYVNFVLHVDSDNQNGADFTLSLNNLVSKNVYNTMLKALATVETTDDLTSTLDLVGWLAAQEAGNSLVSDLKSSAFDGKTYGASTVSFTNTQEADGEAVVALVGLMVNEETFNIGLLG